MLNLTNVSVSYVRGLDALSGVSFTLKQGEMLAVLGANGAGKSTLLRALSGLLPLRSGSITMDGEDISTLPPHGRVRAGVVHIPEGRQMFAGLSVEENLLLGGYVHRRKPSRLAHGIERVYQMFPVLKEKRNQASSILSGGQQQMVAIGRAIMSEPKLLMCDEPSLGLAPIVAEQILDVLRQLCNEGIPVLLIEQNARKALAVSDRAVVLKRGQIVKEGTAAELGGNESVQDAYLGR